MAIPEFADCAFPCDCQLMRWLTRVEEHPGRCQSLQDYAFDWYMSAMFAMRLHWNRHNCKEELSSTSFQVTVKAYIPKLRKDKSPWDQRCKLLLLYMLAALIQKDHNSGIGKCSHKTCSKFAKFALDIDLCIDLSQEQQEATIQRANTYFVEFPNCTIFDSTKLEGCETVTSDSSTVGIGEYFATEWCYRVCHTLLQSNGALMCSRRAVASHPCLARTYGNPMALLGFARVCLRQVLDHSTLLIYSGTACSKPEPNMNIAVGSVRQFRHRNLSFLHVLEQHPPETDFRAF
eukprot:6011800-Amphidinium_carterae.1